jgi:ammonium transporter, Amt family
MLCAGCVRKKNIQNTLLKNLLDACGSSVAFFAVGYAFAFGNTLDGTKTSKTFMGTSNFFLVDVDDLSFWFFEFVFSAAAGTFIKCERSFMHRTKVSSRIYHVAPHGSFFG